MNFKETVKDLNKRTDEIYSKIKDNAFSYQTDGTIDRIFFADTLVFMSPAGDDLFEKCSQQSIEDILICFTSMAIAPNNNFVYVIRKLKDMSVDERLNYYRTILIGELN